MPDHTVTITYNRTANQGQGKVIVPATPINVTASTETIEFDLQCNPALPAGHTAKIIGIEFGKANEPSGTFAAENVFLDKQTKTMNNVPHTVFGKAKVGNPEDLVLTDNNNATATSGTQEYGYKVWIELDDNSGTVSHVEGYKASDDPKIRNEEGGG